MVISLRKGGRGFIFEGMPVGRLRNRRRGRKPISGTEQNAFNVPRRLLPCLRNRRPREMIEIPHMPGITRRECMAASAASVLAFADAGLLIADAKAKSPVIDTHLHCFAGKDDKRFPYHPDGPYK